MKEKKKKKLSIRKSLTSPDQKREPTAAAKKVVPVGGGGGGRKNSFFDKASNLRGREKKTKSWGGEGFLITKGGGEKGKKSHFAWGRSLGGHNQEKELGRHKGSLRI